MKFMAQFQENKEKRCGGEHRRAASVRASQAPLLALPVPQTGFKSPVPTSTSSPAPTIHGLGGPIRRIVGASGERMRGVGPCGRPSDVLISLFEMCLAQGPHLALCALTSLSRRTQQFQKNMSQNDKHLISEA